MPKNKGKGGKNRRRGKNENESEKRELIFKEDGQEYAQVIKMLGNGRLSAFCFDGQTRLCHIRGKLRKKVWINQGDIILIGLRDFQDEKADVLLRYNPDEARSLKAYGELPEEGLWRCVLLGSFSDISFLCTNFQLRLMKMLEVVVKEMITMILSFLRTTMAMTLSQMTLMLSEEIFALKLII
jgi:translation initiation factor 1A